MTIGRPNKGVGHVEGLHGGEHEKVRLRLILETISGERSVQDACEQMGIKRARFAELRASTLQAACDELAPRRPGRPRKRDPARDAELERLRRERDQLRDEVATAQLRAELALTLPPHLLERPRAPQKGGGGRRARASRGLPG